jgi:predicted DNA-binding transcriptional regulator AlpA
MPELHTVRPEAAETMHTSPRTSYTAPHGSLAVCAYCGKPFTPRIRSGPNVSRFCQPAHKDAYHNKRRRGAKENNPSAATYQVTITIPYRGKLLVLDRATFDEAARRGQVLAAASTTSVDTASYLDIWKVITCVGYCRSGIYALINRGKFPAPTVLSGVGRKRRVGWQSQDIAAWLRQQAAP